jgi:dihydroorotase
MNLIIRKAIILDPSSPHHQKKMDILIENGIISNIDTHIENHNQHQEIEQDGLHISNGWFDSSVSFGEPGYEERETIAHGLKVAANAGFTDIALQPATNPVIDNQSQVFFLKEKSKNFPTNLHPIGALTKGLQGTDLAELFDMKNAGAVAFGDYQKTVSNPLLQKIALQYVQDFDGLIISYVEDAQIKGKGVVHEGFVSTTLGLKGIPPLAEEMAVARDLFLLEYTGGKLHFNTISTEKSVELIRIAKAKGLQVTCGVAIANLVLNDTVLNQFDTRFKVSPPIRSENHRLALINGVLDGTIDHITSNHLPIDIEFKKLEFELSKDGTIGLEAMFGMLNLKLPLEIIIQKLTALKTLFGIENHKIDIGQKACLTLFETESLWIFNEEHIQSKSKNCAFISQQMKGKVLGIINNNQWIKNA